MRHIQQPIYSGHRPPRAKGSLLSLPGARYYPVNALRTRSNNQDHGSQLQVPFKSLLNACKTSQTGRMNSRTGVKCLVLASSDHALYIKSRANLPLSQNTFNILAFAVVEATAMLDTSSLFITLALHRSEERCLLTHPFPATPTNLNSW